MIFAAGYFILYIVGFLVLLLLGWLYYDKRYKTKDSPEQSKSLGMYNGDFIRTPEVFIDPKDGLKYRVYYNPKTGEREYVRED